MTSALELECILVKVLEIDGWWRIERKHHDGREWEVKRGSCTCLCLSSRLGHSSDADIEGSSFEMLAIAEAIQNSKSISFTRCEAKTVDIGVALMSPRNSREATIITHACAQRLAVDILSKIETYA